MLATTPLIGRVAGRAQTKSKRLDEFDLANTKIAHSVSSRLTDDDILFLKQIGMRWARVEFGEEEVPFEKLRAIHEPFAKQGIGIYSCVQSAYRSNEAISPARNGLHALRSA